MSWVAIIVGSLFICGGIAGAEISDAGRKGQTLFLNAFSCIIAAIGGAMVLFGVLLLYNLVTWSPKDLVQNVVGASATPRIEVLHATNAKMPKEATFEGETLKVVPDGTPPAGFKIQLLKDTQLVAIGQYDFNPTGMLVSGVPAAPTKIFVRWYQEDLANGKAFASNPLEVERR